MYDDVVYALTGQSVAIEAKLIGGGAALSNWASTPPHSPFSELIAITVHGIDLDWSSGLYIVNTILASILLFALSSLFSSVLSRQLIIASVLMASPIGFLAIDEFRPDVFFVLLSCFAILLVPLGRSLNGRLLPSESALLIGICLLYVKPSWANIPGLTTRWRRPQQP